MKKPFFSLLLAVSLASFIHGTERASEAACQIFVGGKEESLDHLPFFEQVLSSHCKANTILQFGMTFSTQWLLDAYPKVISVEVVTHGRGPENMLRHMGFYKRYSNWIPIAFFSGHIGDKTWAPYKYEGSDAVYKAESYQNLTAQNYGLIHDFYLAELEDFTATLCRCHEVGVAFVDGATILRGDLVSSLFNHVPIIFATSTQDRITKESDYYGFIRLKTPSHYEEIFVGHGITAWVKKEEKYRDLRKALKQYGLHFSLRDRKS